MNEFADDTPPPNTNPKRIKRFSKAITINAGETLAQALQRELPAAVRTFVFTFDANATIEIGVQERR